MYGGHGVAKVKGGDLCDYVVIPSMIKELHEKVRKVIKHTYGD
jgi:hypothetical protein